MMRAQRLHWLHGFLATALVAGTITASVLLNNGVMADIERSRRLVQRATTQANTVRGVVSSMLDIETGERGFLLTNEPTYLEPFEAGRSRLGKLLSQLDALTEGTPMLHDNWLALRRLALGKEALSVQLVALARARGSEAATAEMQADGSKATMDLLRAQAEGMLRRIDEDHETRIADVRTHEAQALWAGALTAAGCTILLGLAVMVLLRNRAQLQRTQAALGAQTSRLSGTIAHMRDGIAVFSKTGELLLWNQQFADLAQIPAEVLRLGASIEQIAATAWPDAKLAASRRDLPTLIEMRNDRQTFEIWRGRMPDEGEILVVADITRRSDAEAIARQAQKMEALGQLTGGVAHDFNNLLQVVSTNLELIGIRLAGSTVAMERLAAAMGAVGRASRLTRHLLAFARQQPLRPATIDTASLLRGLEDMLLRTLGDGIAMTLRLEPDLWPTRADPQQLESAILNLTINARDAMEGRGSLVIKATNGRLNDEDAARIPEVAAGSYVVIAITDTGIGMSDEQLRRALEPFYTTKAEGRGSGLGLPMVFGFAKQSHGHLQLCSTPGVGTTARLYLPRDLALPAPVPEPAREPERAHGEMVLLVEDDATVRAAAAQALVGLGYRTAEADSAAAALDLLREGLRPDLLFTDLIMPGRPDARTMAEQARLMVPNLAVVFTSGYSDAALTGPDRADLATILVGKPWRTADLALKLRQALNARGLPPAAAKQPLDQAHRLRIVLAEDDELVRMTTAEQLIRMGHDVAEAGTAAEALGLVTSGCDLLVTDLGLPDRDGTQLVKSALESRADLPVIIASGRGPATGSPHTWLEKPYTAEMLKSAVDRAISPQASRRAPQSASVA